MLPDRNSLDTTFSEVLCPTNHSAFPAVMHRCRALVQALDALRICSGAPNAKLATPAKATAAHIRPDSVSLSPRVCSKAQCAQHGKCHTRWRYSTQRQQPIIRGDREPSFSVTSRSSPKRHEPFDRILSPCE